MAGSRTEIDPVSQIYPRDAARGLGLVGHAVLLQCSMAVAGYMEDLARARGLKMANSGSAER
ncbi:hypothetical protein [Bryobacter aggregatus]|uniref:hypothetical protein n=1 Tax=Bryobacter aggregatus TaxID=360054 RepID=UPI0004E0CBB2|nr:hypothetical protein [Bryobacter aggregatus]